jgi:hypothetical protein
MKLQARESATSGMSKILDLIFITFPESLTAFHHEGT